MRPLNPRPPRGKVVSLARLKRALHAQRRAGRRVVFTNGVFDLLHPGHVGLLQRARLLGDLLVVGLNSDASVRRLKGAGQPFMEESQRAFMLASLEAVDYVITFKEDTPLEVIQQIQPDVLVKGGDWKAKRIVGRQVVEARDGRVVRVSILGGFSTTSIARKIRTRRRR